MAYTVTPSGVNDQGQPTGYDVSHDNGGHYKDWQQDFVEDEKGKMHHVFESVQLEDDTQSALAYDDDAYIAALIEANPNLSAAQEWASNNLPIEQIEEFNAMINSPDLKDVNTAIERLIAQYEDEASNQVEQSTEEQSPEEDEEPLTYETLDDEEREIVDTAIENLSSNEALGSEVADAWTQASEQAAEAGDDCYAGIAAMTASFHHGEITADEAIRFVFDNYEFGDIVRVYSQIRENSWYFVSLVNLHL